MASAFRSTFRRVNLSLMSCTSAELISVSARNKIQIKKLHLQTVENRSHLQVYETSVQGSILGTLLNTWAKNRQRLVAAKHCKQTLA